MEGSASTSADGADEADIRELVRRQQAGWNAGDATQYAAVFTDVADYVTFLGAHHRGRDAIADSYAPLFRRLLRGSRLDVRIHRVRFVSPDVAIVHAHATVARRGRRRRAAVRINTSVAVRSVDGWRLAASQNTTRRRVAAAILSGIVRTGHVRR